MTNLLQVPSRRARPPPGNVEGRKTHIKVAVIMDMDMGTGTDMEVEKAEAVSSYN